MNSSSESFQSSKKKISRSELMDRIAKLEREIAQIGNPTRSIVEKWTELRNIGFERIEQPTRDSVDDVNRCLKGSSGSNVICEMEEVMGQLSAVIVILNDLRNNKANGLGRCSKFCLDHFAVYVHKYLKKSRSVPA